VKRLADEAEAKRLADLDAQVEDYLEEEVEINTEAERIAEANRIAAA
jgi:hypothetical protein